MKPVPLKVIEEASKIIKDRPHLATGIYFSKEEKRKFKEREGDKIVRAYSVVLEKYLKSKEGQATTKLFKQVWEIPDKEKWHNMTLGWLRWRVFLYKGEPRNGSNNIEIIWFGGNGLELYFVERGVRQPQIKPTTPKELFARMVMNESNWDQAQISRPEQVVPYIRLITMDLVRYLNR